MIYIPLQLCGTYTEGRNIQSLGRTVELTFYTDVRDRYSGFALSINFFDDPSLTVNTNGMYCMSKILLCQSGVSIVL